MILLQKDDDPIFQHDLPGLLWLEVVQVGRGNRLPRLVLLREERDGRKKRGEDCACQNDAGKMLDERTLHCAPPSFCADAAGAAVSIHALVRLLETKTSLATRRMSAFDTLSTRSNRKKSSRQSPYLVWYSDSAKASPWLSASPLSRRARVRGLNVCSSSSLTSVVWSLAISLWMASRISAGVCPGTGTA